MDLVFYVSSIKIDADSLCASQEQYVFRHHVTMQLPQLAMRCNIKEMGAWFHKEWGGGNIWTFDPMGKSQISKGEPIKLSTTHFVFCAESSRSWLGKVNAWGWEEYGSQIRIWEATHFWKTCFWFRQANAWKCMPKPLFTHVFHSSPTIIHIGSLGLFPSRFCGCFLIS